MKASSPSKESHSNASPNDSICIYDALLFVYKIRRIREYKSLSIGLHQLDLLVGKALGEHIFIEVGQNCNDGLPYFDCWCWHASICLDEGLDWVGVGILVGRDLGLYWVDGSLQ